MCVGVSVDSVSVIHSLVNIHGPVQHSWNINYPARDIRLVTARSGGCYSRLNMHDDSIAELSRMSLVESLGYAEQSVPTSKALFSSKKFVKFFRFSVTSNLWTHI
jgi:hypothetical protein